MSTKRKRRSVLVAVIVLLLLAAAVVVMMLLAENLQRQEYKLIYVDEIKKYAEEYDLDPYLVAAVIHVESGNRTDAVSNKGALGLMQLMPATAEWVAGKLGEEYDQEAVTLPEKNIQYGCWYLHFLFERFDSTAVVCAAYNAGHNAVFSWLEEEEYSSDGSSLDRIPYPETENYVEKVMLAYDKYKELYPKAFD